MITKSMVGQGYDRGIVRLDISPHGDGVVCVIGEYWFYFCGPIAERYDDVDAYRRDFHRDVIIDEIYSTLDWYKNDDAFEDEYYYYEAILREGGCT